MINDTVFDKILRHEIPAKIVFENDFALAFHDTSPKAPVHVLVIPKKKIINLASSKNEESEILGQLMLAVRDTAELLGLTHDGYRVVLNSGVHGGQSVDYLHCHILGGRELAWPPG